MISEKFDRNGNASDDAIVARRLKKAIHPGKLVGDYIHHSKLPPSFYFENIKDLQLLIDKKIPFGDYFHAEFSKHMGAQADLLVRMQTVYDYEQKTGLRFSGRWKGTEAEQILMPQ